MRKLATVAALIAAAAVGAGCGSDDTDTTSAAAPDTPSERLSAERFAAAERVYEAVLPIDELPDEPDPRKLESKVAEVVEACDEVAATGDELLDALTRDCELMAVAAEATTAASDCADPAGCGREIVKAAESMIAIANSAVEAIPTVEAEVAAGPCREVLTSARHLGLFSDMAQNLRTMGEAIRDGDDETALAAANRAIRIGERAERLPDAAATLARFRRACAPEGS
ncbi:MAG: hypothetical protein GXY03_12560 [Solirubrobacterales bacterium]|nr:hypothetical protein [Solirubrobacterales bacterium]